MSTIKELVLLDDEQVLYQIEGNAFTDSANPIVKLIASITRLVWMIIGLKLITYIVVTDKRVIRVDKKTILWGIIPKDTVVSTLNKRTIQSVGYAKAIRWFVFKTVYFRLENMTENIVITHKGSVNEVSGMVGEISKLVAA